MPLAGMIFNGSGIVAAVLSLAAFAGCRVLALSKESIRSIWCLAFALFLAVPGASFVLYYTHWLPERDWYYEFRSLPGSEFAVVLVGMAGGLIAARLPRTLLIVPLFGVAVASIVPFLKPLIGPLPPSWIQDRWEGDVCLQSTASTCGPASAATILRDIGVSANERELARAAFSYLGGTEAWYLARAIRGRGCPAEFCFSEGFDPNTKFPAIAGVRIGPSGHFIAILSREGDRFRVGDPLHGMSSLTESELTSIYDFSGFYLTISKPGGGR